jgi:hypothetical protein
MRAVTDDVAATEDVLDAEAIDFLQHRLKSRKVGVNVGNDRDKLHVHSLKGCCQADAAYPLYRAMGFVPFSERGSGLTRRSAVAEPPAGNEEAAA